MNKFMLLFCSLLLLVCFSLSASAVGFSPGVVLTDLGARSCASCHAGAIDPSATEVTPDAYVSDANREHISDTLMMRSLPSAPIYSDNEPMSTVAAAAMYGPAFAAYTREVSLLPKRSVAM